MQESNIITISNSDPLFPSDFNRVLPKITKVYAIGNTDLLAQGRCLSIVGSRRPTNYGQETTAEFAQAAARAGFTIVSGLAFGIDSIAHQAALDCGGKTIAILPTGLQNIYPVSHAYIAKQIVATGGLLLSEYANGAPPMKHYFIRRNRLIAALSDTLLVTEGGKNSGSKHTADFAIDLGKDICVIPGHITSPLSVVPNNLLKEGAHPMITPSDLLTILGVHENLMKRRYSAKNKYEQLILNLLRTENLSVEAMLQASQLEVSTFNVHLTMLEIKGVIEQTASKSWRLAK
ncbi:MAG: DNA-processing protein DprA [Candidatus Saccharimonadales bacterium]